MSALNLRRATPITEPINGRPKGLHVERVGERLRIWFAWRCLDYLAVCLGAVWFGVMGVCLCVCGGWYIGLGCGLLVPAAGLGWIGLAGMVNRTVIEAGERVLCVRHGPVPWPGAREKAGDVLQLYCSVREVGRSWGPLVRMMAAMEDGRRVALTWILPPRRAGWGIHIEKAIEEHLGIVNRPVLCPECGYDLRATLRRCPECGYVIRSNKRERRLWGKAMRKLLRRKSGRP